MEVFVLVVVVGLLLFLGSEVLGPLFDRTIGRAISRAASPRLSIRAYERLYSLVALVCAVGLVIGAYLLLAR